MNKLFHASLSRMFKDTFFRLSLLFMLLVGIYISLKSQVELDRIVFAYTFFIGLVSAVFCGMFVGTEYSDGTLRNKLIIGHLKSSIYLSHLFINIISGFIFCIAFLIPILTIGIIRLGGLEMEGGFALLLFIVSMLMSAAYSSIYTLISMTLRNKASGAVISILAFILLISIAGFINSKLSEPEFIENVTMTVSDLDESQREPNPNYLKGSSRDIYQTIYDINPAGQSLQFYEMKFVNFQRLPIYSFIILIITVIIGVSLFDRLDIK